MDPEQTLSLDRLPRGASGRLLQVGGERPFRRRLMELGLTPGVEVRLLKVAPLGDPLEIEARGCRLSIRRAEARQIQLGGVELGTAALAPSPNVPARASWSAA